MLHNIADLNDLEGFEEPLMDDLPDEEAARLPDPNGGEGFVDAIGDPVDAEGGKILRDEICRQIAMGNN